MKDKWYSPEMIFVKKVSRGLDQWGTGVYAKKHLQNNEIYIKYVKQIMQFDQRGTRVFAKKHIYKIMKFRMSNKLTQSDQ